MSRRLFAQITTNNIVGQVIVAESSEWCESALGGEWVETFKDASQRYHFAGAGFSYDRERDAFIPPKPYKSWVLDESTCTWEAPIEKPAGNYVWVEETVSWEKAPSLFESWTWDEGVNDWIAPSPMPEDGNDYEWNEGTQSWDVVNWG